MTTKPGKKKATTKPATMGRPTDYGPAVLVAAQKYVDTCPQDKVMGRAVQVNIPTIEGLALHLKISRDTVYDWSKKYKDFSYIVKTLLAEQGKRLVQSGLSGMYNPTIAKLLLASKHDYVERHNVEQTRTFDLSGLEDLPDADLDKLLNGLTQRLNKATEGRPGNSAPREGA